ncbi:glycosyltransferase family 2 protein [Microbacterium sulfonylureivorans]|uniref:glycosyltransferase family 2 protein n=1 Tax=Microbacterium sulfonylureivorans TaxID=2486854 RepID=UPI000FD90325|nr:glycosyltransferase family 2 protein [Microbacterium sulfonylureivorans]
MADVDLVLPCLNEAAALPWVLDRVPANYRAIVVDNGSTDGSAGLARDAGATVVVEHRRGFGAAVAAGVAAADAPVVAICDADASLDPAVLPQLVGLLEGGADLVLGRRVPTERSAWPLHARAANAVLSRRIGRLAGVHLADIGPMRVARTDALRELHLADRRSGYPLEMVLRAAAAGWRIVETDVTYSPRIGRSKVTGTVRGTLTAVHDMNRVLREVRT